MIWTSSYKLIKSSWAFSAAMVLPFTICAVIYLLTNMCHTLMLRVGIAADIDGCLKTFLEGLELGIWPQKILEGWRCLNFSFIYKSVSFLLEELVKVGKNFHNSFLGIDINRFLGNVWMCLIVFHLGSKTLYSFFICFRAIWKEWKLIGSNGSWFRKWFLFIGINSCYFLNSSCLGCTRAILA